MKTLPLFAVVISILSAVVPAAPAASAAKDQNPELVGLPAGERSVILEWNAALCGWFEQVPDAARPEFVEGASSHAQARIFAMVQLAMRDATGAFPGVINDAGKKAQASLAASAAAREVLAAMIAPETKPFSTIHERARAAVPNAADAASAVKIGQRAGAAILQRRRADGWPVFVASEHASAQAGLDLLRSSVGAGSHPSKSSAWSIVAPFGLKRVGQFEPEQPYFVYSNGLVMPNETLRKKNRIGALGDVAPSPSTRQAWRTFPLVRWNRAAQALAERNPATVPEQARLFAALNTALADALLAGSYWNDNYSAGRVDFVVDLVDRGGEPDERMGPRDVPILPAGTPITVAGYPALTAVLAGAAESVLAKHFGGGEAMFGWAGPPGADVADRGALAPPPITLHAAARECAWVMLADGTASLEGCLAGYDLGYRIGEYVHKQLAR